MTDLPRTPRPTTATRSFLRVAGAVAIFAATFGITTALLRPGYSSDPEFRAKLDYFERHKDEFDAIFFGSSRLYRGIDPREFDRALAALGHPIQSFNLSTRGMTAHEISALLERVIAMRPARLRWVFTELMQWQPDLPDGARNRDRTVDWHTTSETLAVCRTVWLANDSVPQKAEQLSMHLSHWAQHLTNFGEGHRRIRSLLGLDPIPPELSVRIREGLGFFPVDQESGPDYAQRREAFLATDYDRFLAQAAGPDDDRLPAPPLDTFNIAATRRQEERARRSGLVPVWIIPPSHRSNTRILDRLQAEKLVSNVLAFDDPAAYPDLYRRDLYFDRVHLNGRGARVFSAAVARRFGEWLDRG